jgi:hypothetical protein
MNKILLVILAIVTLNVHGQNHLLGVKGSVGRANVSSSNFIINNHYRNSLAIGLTYDCLFKKHFSVGGELSYNQFGFTNDIIYMDEVGTPTGEKATNRYNYDYLSIPLKVGFNYGTTVYGFANLGLINSILVDAKTILPAIDFNGIVIPEETLNVTDRVNRFDIGGFVEIGGGCKFKERYWLFTSFSFQHSFTSITNSEYFAHSSIRHYRIALNLGLKYALSKE